MKPHEALIVVDMQSDFMPGGPLAVPGGDEIIEGIIKIIPNFETVVFTQDWHPADHKSFASQHEGKKPFVDIVKMHGEDQVLWPDHCVQRTAGAMIHPSLRSSLDYAHVILRKGTNPEIDSYSAFSENWGPGHQRKSTGLMGMLLERVVRKIFVVGLARDYCVMWTAMDIGMVIPTAVIWNLTRSVRNDAETDYYVSQELRKKSVEIVI